MIPMVEAIQAALATPQQDGFTVVELIAQAGLPASDHSRAKVRAFLKAEIVAGRVTSRIGRRVSIAGVPVAIPIYLPVRTARNR